MLFRSGSEDGASACGCTGDIPGIQTYYHNSNERYNSECCETQSPRRDVPAGIVVEDVDNRDDEDRVLSDREEAAQYQTFSGTELHHALSRRAEADGHKRNVHIT